VVRRKSNVETLKQLSKSPVWNEAVHMHIRWNSARHPGRNIFVRSTYDVKIGVVQSCGERNDHFDTSTEVKVPDVPALQCTLAPRPRTIYIGSLHARQVSAIMRRNDAVPA
jgi:hypothetical protein